MNYHQSYVFLQDLSNSFHRWFNLSNFHSGVPQLFGGVSPCHSRILQAEEEFLLNPYPFFQRFMVLAWCHPHNCFDCDNSFLTIQSISWVVSISFLRSPSCHNSSFSACSSRSPNHTGASFKYYLISSGSLRSLVSKFSQVSSFIF